MWLLNLINAIIKHRENKKNAPFSVVNKNSALFEYYRVNYKIICNFYKFERKFSTVEFS